MNTHAANHCHRNTLLHPEGKCETLECNLDSEFVVQLETLLSNRYLSQFLDRTNADQRKRAGKV